MTTTSTTNSKYSEEELEAVFTELVLSGSYQETVTLKGPVTATFITRNVAVTDQIQDELDSLTSNLISTHDQRRSLLNLAGSLIEYNGARLPSVFKDRLTALSNLPAPIVSLLLKKLQSFEDKVYAAVETGEENF